jgi:hypothetical protein
LTTKLAAFARFATFLFMIYQNCPTVDRILPDCPTNWGGYRPSRPPARYAYDFNTSKQLCLPSCKQPLRCLFRIGKVQFEYQTPCTKSKVS